MTYLNGGVGGMGGSEDGKGVGSIAEMTGVTKTMSQQNLRVSVSSRGGASHGDQTGSLHTNI